MSNAEQGLTEKQKEEIKQVIELALVGFKASIKNELGILTDLYHNPVVRQNLGLPPLPPENPKKEKEAKKRSNNLDEDQKEDGPINEKRKKGPQARKAPAVGKDRPKTESKKVREIKKKEEKKKTEPRKATDSKVNKHPGSAEKPAKKDEPDTSLKNQVESEHPAINQQPTGETAKTPAKEEKEAITSTPEEKKADHTQQDGKDNKSPNNPKKEEKKKNAGKEEKKISPKKNQKQVNEKEAVSPQKDEEQSSHSVKAPESKEQIAKDGVTAKPGATNRIEGMNLLQDDEKIDIPLGHELENTSEEAEEKPVAKEETKKASGKKESKKSPDKKKEAKKVLRGTKQASPEGK